MIHIEPHEHPAQERQGDQPRHSRASHGNEFTCEPTSWSMSCQLYHSNTTFPHKFPFFDHRAEPQTTPIRPSPAGLKDFTLSMVSFRRLVRTWLTPRVNPILARWSLLKGGCHFEASTWGGRVLFNPSEGHHTSTKTPSAKHLKKA